MIVLLVAFGSMIAMAIPIVTALLGLAIGLGGVGIMAYFVDTPVISTMIASMIGLGVGIDYALFVVTRHRQHLHEGMSVEDAAGVANATAGQSVLFAGMTVVIAITGLRDGRAAGDHGDGLRGRDRGAVLDVHRRHPAPGLPRASPGGTSTAGRSRTARIVAARRTRRSPASGPTTSASARGATRSSASPACSLLAAPVLGLSMGFSDDSNKSADATEHKAYDLLTDGFGKGFNGPLAIVVDLTDERDPGRARPHQRPRSPADPGIAAVQPALVNADRRHRGAHGPADHVAAGHARPTPRCSGCATT